MKSALQPGTDLPLHCVALCALAIAVLVGLGTGCGEREPEIRRYREVSSVAAPPPATTPAPAAAPAPPVAWTAPEGWEEKPGGNMRIATFATEDGRECTLTAFPGDVGGLEANARRWLGQLRVPEPGNLAAFVEAAETLSSRAGLEGRLLDFRPLVAGDGDAMLAAAFRKGDFTVFVKLTAPAAVLADEEARFRDLCLSLR